MLDKAHMKQNIFIWECREYTEWLTVYRGLLDDAPDQNETSNKFLFKKEKG